jgi:hypothetical protein
MCRDMTTPRGWPLAGFAIEGRDETAGWSGIGRDRFTKVGGHSRIVYVVESAVESYGYGGLPHVRLVAEGQHDGMLMSVSALLDDHFWSRIPSERN